MKNKLIVFTWITVVIFFKMYCVFQYFSIVLMIIETPLKVNILNLFI